MTVTAPDGFSLDVRASILMDDGAQIYVEYKGRVKLTEQGLAKMQAAELLTSEDFYFITSPTVMTIAEKYLWAGADHLSISTICMNPFTLYKFDTMLRNNKI